MGVSFKVARKGSRFRPKPVIQPDEVALNEASENSKEGSLIGARNPSSKRKVEDTEDVADISSTPISEDEVAFTLDLYRDGYSIGKVSENDAARRPPIQDASKVLHPYDRASEAMFSAIESGRLPGDILDDIPCKYTNGTLVCEVRDYRNCATEQGSGMPSLGGAPTMNRVRLKMSLENVVKDIPLISDNSWTYGDLMEVEARIVKALQPILSLDPTPELDRLSATPLPSRLNLNLSSLRKKRLRQMPNVTVMSTNRLHGKKVSIDQVPESSSSRFAESGHMMQQYHVQENMTSPNLGPGSMLGVGSRSFQDGNVQAIPLVSHQQRYQAAAGNPRGIQDHGSAGSLVNISTSSSVGQDMMVNHSDNMSAGASLHGKRENPDGQQTSQLPNFNKRSRMNSVGPEGIQQPQMDNLQTSDMNWRNSLLQQQVMARGMQYGNNVGIQKYPQMFEGVTNQRFGPKEEQFDLEKLDGGSELSQGNKSDMQMERLPQHMMRPNFPPATAWSNFGQETRKEDQQVPKRKSAQSPRVSGGALAQSPLSSRSGEFSSNSAGLHIGAVAAATAALGSSQKDKSAVTSTPRAAASLNSSGNDSLPRQHQQPAQVVSKRKSNSVPRTTAAMSGVASPASVGNMNAASPMVGAAQLADQVVLERFAKLEMVASRHKLHCKKNKVDDYPRKPNVCNPQLLAACLSNPSNNEDFKDDSEERQLSNSLVGGSRNAPKMRVMNFMQGERVLQGNVVAYVPKARARMVLMEKSSDGTVAMHYGDLEDGDILSAEEYLPTLPNTHHADLLAKQFCTLMSRDGYLVENHIEQKPTRMLNIPLSSQPPILTGNNSTLEMQQHQQQYNEAVAAQQAASNDVKPALNGGIVSVNQSLNPRMLPPGNSQALQMSQGLSSGASPSRPPQQLDAPLSVQQQQHQQQNQNALLQQQQHQQQLQRTQQMALPSSPLSHLNAAIGQNSNNMHLAGQMVNKQQQTQLQVQQQQLQQRKMMMGLGGHMGMGNNMVGLGTLGNAMAMGAARGLAGPGISGPMNMGQNPMNIGQTQQNIAAIQQFRSGQLTPQQAAYLTTKFRLNQRSGVAGMSPGVRQMTLPNAAAAAGISMMSQPMNRTNMGQMQQQRSAMNPMGPPKLMAGMNMFMNQQQQNQQLQLQPQQLQQQLQQQPESTSSLQSLQGVVSPSQVGSPSTIGLQQQQQPLQHPSPQQMARTPMSPQISSGAIHAMSGGNPEGCPASPQLSSQTVNSIGSITNSPMELQGVNKSNSGNNV
ncbi:unnamed protein product [Linum tenue]|uniref:Uncharacterized protein n=1 Tax=Linum tenue TaxID=586396 RepID=A0AAV0KB77_9ROSI|nr:unnamed protein product [Linum tenue]